MNTKRPCYYAGGIYHLYNRGANRSPIFFEEKNYHYVITKLHTYTHRLKLSLIAYCFLKNHYHLLVRQNADHAAGLLPQRIFNGYTKAINKMYGRSGTLFQGPYLVKCVQTEAHLLHLCRYIHANPVKHGVCPNAEDWLFSDYHTWSGTQFERAELQKLIGVYFKDGAAYKEYVQDYIEYKRTLEDVDAYLELWDDV